MTRSFHAAPSDFSQDEPTAFVLVAHGPPVPNEEVERAEKDALEVRVLWDETPLATHYLDSEGSVVIGDHEESIARIPASALGAPAFEVARTTASGFLVRLPPGAAARLGRGMRAIEVEGPREWETSRGDAVSMNLGHFRLEIVHGGAGKTVPRAGLLEQLRETATTHISGAALLHTALFGIFAYYTPVLAGDDDGSAMARSEQITLMRAYLGESAERERERVEDRATAGPSGTNEPSGGSRAAGESGKMGSEHAPAADKRWGKAGPKENATPMLGRAGDRPAGFEMIGIVAQSTGDRTAPTTPWGPLDAVGADPINALGNMFGSTIGDAAGLGGLDLSGTGEGGGGTSQQIGLNLNDVGRPGHGLGPPGSGVGPGGWGIGTSCPGCQLRGHAPGAPSLRAGTTILAGGHMPAEVIQRVVRDNFGRFRNCYEAGLRENPSLEGRVVTRFAIDRQGAVSMAQDGGSSLPNAKVVECVVRSFYSLSFPEHEGGVVTVVYPLALRPE